MDVPERQRTADVLGSGAMRAFSELLLPQHLLLALREAGYERPSPVQEAAVPLARSGADLVVQAKSGTGKTLVFGIAAVELVRLNVPLPQVLVVAPTREIALQVGDVISALGARLPAPGLALGTFIGGLPTEEDVRRLRRPCHVVVGTPGRLCALVESRALLVRDVALLVLDEADNLWAADAFRPDVQWLAGALPQRKQVLAMSATFSANALAGIERLMRRPQRIMLAPDHVSLLGVRQYYSLVPEASSGQAQLEAKARAFLVLAARLSFTQAVLFCARQHEAAWLAQRLCDAGFPAAYLSGARSQVERMDTLDAVREFRLRVVVATDLIARGVDLERVNLVANLDLPPSGESYAHRMGRTGRFGTRGVAVTFITAAELPALRRLLAGVPGAQVEELPDEVPKESYQYALPTEEERAALAALLPDARTGSDQKPEPEPEPATVAHAGGDAAPAPEGGNWRELIRTREGLGALKSPTGLRRAPLKPSNGHGGTAAAAHAHQAICSACDQLHGAAEGPHSVPLRHARAHGAAGAQKAAGATCATPNVDALGGGGGASSNGHGAEERGAAERQGAAEALPPRPPADQPVPGRKHSPAGHVPEAAAGSEPLSACELWGPGAPPELAAPLPLLPAWQWDPAPGLPWGPNPAAGAGARPAHEAPAAHAGETLPQQELSSGEDGGAAPPRHSNAGMNEDTDEVACIACLPRVNEVGDDARAVDDSRSVGRWVSHMTLQSEESDGSESACSEASAPAAAHPDSSGAGSGPGSGVPQHADRRAAAACAPGSVSGLGLGPGRAPSRASKAARAAAAAARQAAAEEDALEEAILAAHARCAASDSGAESGHADLDAGLDASVPCADTDAEPASADPAAHGFRGASATAGRQFAEGGWSATGSAGWEPGVSAGPPRASSGGPASAAAHGATPGSWGDPCGWGARATAQPQAPGPDPGAWDSSGAHAGQPQGDHASWDPSWHAPGAGASGGREPQYPGQTLEQGPWDPAWQAAGAEGPDSQGMVSVPGALLARYWRLEWETWRAAMAAWTARYESWAWHWQAAQWQAAQGGAAAHGEAARPDAGGPSRAD